ncbi:hypothetical protein CAMGR0001_0732 [Campylobacter gracilis RM3268]|uniref:Uncharacterized protein n=1 Tax=Campylobacter gracilis RM3268 TaxID=553220 RepID=C8PFU0_9BACT|nr:hypothetical protein CAMGR0001_0732 [Campylobacter gracilis RM3268]
MAYGVQRVGREPAPCGSREGPNFAREWACTMGGFTLRVEF